jgi:hypothetical protein
MGTRFWGVKKKPPRGRRAITDTGVNSLSEASSYQRGFGAPLVLKGAKSDPLCKDKVRKAALVVYKHDQPL